MTGLKFVCNLLLDLVTIYGLYFVISGVAGLLIKRRRKEAQGDKINHFAILIAARNEAETIGGLLKSLHMLDYPRDKYSVYVIPNNCTDHTRQIALENGARVIDCTVPTKTKAEVLRFAFDRLRDHSEIDAYVFFDADNVVDSRFLTHMNRSLNAGYRVAQGFRDAKNPADNWISASYAIYFLFQNVFFNHARKNMGLSATINGTGFMIKKELIDEAGFDTRTLTEDMEYSGLCALRDEKIDFVEEAVTYDEYPVDFKSSWTQRKRWTAGNISCMKLYSAKLFRHFLKSRRMAALDLTLLYLAPIMQTICYACIALFGLFKVLGMGETEVFSKHFVYGSLSFLASYCFGIITEIFVIKFKRKRIRPLISGLLLFSLFVLTWVPINFACLIKKYSSWEEIKHSRSISISEVSRF